MWHLFDNGRSIGTKGSENGITVLVSGDGVIPPAGVTLKTRHFEWD
jgi:hypothetical protein